MKKRGGYGSLGEVCHALAAQQPERLAATLITLLKEHKTKASAGRNQLADHIVCFPGTVLMIIAKKQGLAIPISSPYISAALVA